MTEQCKKQEYVELDRNVMVETVFPEAADAVLHSVREAPFELYNLIPFENTPVFRRLPEEVSRATSPAVDRLCRESAGGRIRFSTDSRYILLKAVEPVVGRNPLWTLSMSAGFDLYEDLEGESRFVKLFLPPYDMDGGYEQLVTFDSRRWRSFTIHMPIHSQVSEVYIGLQPDAGLEGGRKYRDEKPVVIYGSSIVHGSLASRPGLIYPNILSRNLNMNVIDLGFSGNAKAEEPLMNYLAGLEMSCFVYDYDYNAPTVEYLRATHRRGFDIIRRAQPELPILLISRPDAVARPEETCERRDVILDTFHGALDAGDRNVYYLDGESFFQGKWENDCTADGIHPNDLGFTLMADGIEAVIRRALRKKEAFY